MKSPILDLNAAKKLSSSFSSVYTENYWLLTAAKLLCCDLVGSVQHTRITFLALS